MTGGHDLGGKPGLGSICPEPESHEPVFHADWEKRVFAMTLACGFLGRWNLDESRHARERQRPEDYLRQSYYENWLAGLQTLLAEKGLVSLRELETGTAVGKPAEIAAALSAQAVPQVLSRGAPVDMVIEQEACFSPGDLVRVRRESTGGHTRVPAYLRGREGIIQHHHGAHVFADQHARGQREGQHLYNVAFSSTRIWTDEENPVTDFMVRVDLWEPQLAPL